MKHTQPRLRQLRTRGTRWKNRALTLAAPLVQEFRELEVEGGDQVPASGAVLIACNHLSAFDAAVVQAALERELTVVEVSPVWQSPTSDLQLNQPAWSDLPLERRPAALVAAEAALLVFPEGDPSPDGRLHRGRIGVGALVLEHGLPVVPAVVFDRGRGVRFGAPLEFERYQQVPASRAVARAVTDEVMTELLRLGGQTYADISSQQARREAREDQRNQITARRLASAAKRRALKAADVARHRNRAEERADLRRRAAEVESSAHTDDPGGNAWPMLGDDGSHRR